MRRQERGEACQEAVGQGLAVHAVDDVGLGHAQVSQQGFFQSGGQQAFQGIAYQPFAQAGAAALVAQDEAQRGDVGSDAPAVVVAGVGAGAQYAGYAGLPAAEGAGGGQQVGADFHRACDGEVAAQGALHCGEGMRQAARAVEVQFVHRAGAQGGEQFGGHDACHVVLRLEEGVDALGGYLPVPGACVQYDPVGLGGAAVCYQYHVISG